MTQKSVREVSACAGTTQKNQEDIMNPCIQSLAKELAEYINQKVNIPWLNEEQEQIFFELVVTKILELIMGKVLKQLNKEADTS
jgi:hypothetical protein